jgi:hypothetical protein
LHARRGSSRALRKKRSRPPHARRMDAQTLKKKAFAHSPRMKKHLRQRCGVLFFAPITVMSALDCG